MTFWTVAFILWNQDVLDKVKREIRETLGNNNGNYKYRHTHTHVYTHVCINTHIHTQTHNVTQQGIATKIDVHKFYLILRLVEADLRVQCIDHRAGNI